jgi:hypothetical protein
MTSQLFRHNKSLASNVPDDFLRSIRSSRLPPHFQTILACKGENKLDAVSQMAKWIAKVAPLPTTASIAQTADSAILEKIKDLSRQMAALSSGSTRPRSYSKERRKKNDVPSTSQGPAGRGYCRYDRRIGDKARRCTPPCPYSRQGNGSDRRYWRQTPVQHTPAAYSSLTVSRARFFVETCSDLCVFPRKLVTGRKERISDELFAANGTPIPTYGGHALMFNHGL